MFYEVRVTCGDTGNSAHDRCKRAAVALRPDHPEVRVISPATENWGLILETRDLNEAGKFLVRANAQLAEI